MTPPWRGNRIVRFAAQLRNPGGGWPTDRDPWARISLYESRDLVARLFQARHGRQANDATCREFPSHLLQGRQTFASARGAGELVRPLLHYYGVVALSRGLILFFDPWLREAGLAPSHGASAEAWPVDLGGQRGGPRRVPGPRIGLTVGTFSQLARVTANEGQAQVFSLAGSPEAWGVAPPLFRSGAAYARIPLGRRNLPREGDTRRRA